SSNQFRSAIDKLVFADGQSVDAVALLSGTTPFTDGSGSLYIGAGDSALLAGGAGNDVIFGTSTADHYKMSLGSGVDVILDTVNVASTGDELEIAADPANVTFSL